MLLMLSFVMGVLGAFVPGADPQRWSSQSLQWATVPPSSQFDVIITGATPAGIAAAVTASDTASHSVLLVEELGMIGGMGAAGGLGLNDQQVKGNLTAITGLGHTWATLVGAHYNPTDPSVVRHGDNFVCEEAYWTMLNTAQVTVAVGCIVASAVTKAAAIQSVTVNCGPNGTHTYTADVFIDATYDADLTVAAGVTTTFGREAASTYNESMAGVFLFDQPLETFDGLNVSVTWDNGTLLPYVDPSPLQPQGTGDPKLMAFQYRACVSTDSDRIPFAAPTGYDPSHFELLARTVEAYVSTGKHPEGPAINSLFGFGPYSEEAHGNKFIVCCGSGAVNSDMPGLNVGWANATHAERRAMAWQHRYFLQGAFYWLGNDPRSPATTQASAKKYGLCADEFVEYEHWPPQLYVRESNRLVGEKVMTQHDFFGPRNKPDSVSMALWEEDKHTVAVQKKDDGAGGLIAVNEGFFRHPVNPKDSPTHWCGCPAYDLWYDVSFSTMVPKAADATNLLVPVALSTSSVAFSSTRIETMYMDLGSAAGIAAGMIADKEAASVQTVNVTAIQSELVRRYHQRIHGPFWQ